MQLAAKGDVHRHHHLLDRAIAIDPVGADVARQIEQLVRAIIHRRQALQDLLIGGIGRYGRSSSTRLMVAPSMGSRAR
jgi:hypothetical protein